MTVTTASPDDTGNPNRNASIARRSRRSAPMRSTTLLLAALATSLAVEPRVSAKDEIPSKSGPLALALSKQLADAKLDYIAASDPGEPGRWVAAMHMAGVQISLISAKYSVPELLREKMVSHKYQDIYVDLSSASDRASRVIIDDLKGNGLARVKPKAPPFDVYESGGKKTTFDFEWRKQKLTEEEFFKTLETADEQYARLLGLLLDEAKKPK
jgi:hypothetical protein